MSLLSWLKDNFSWKTQLEASKTTCPLESLNITSEILNKTVEETTEITRKLAKKLEKVQAELDDREELLDIIFNTIPDFLLLKDGIGRWKILNNYGKKVYGITSREYKGKTDKEIANTISPRFKQALTQCLSTDEEAWLAGIPTEFEEHSEDSFGRKSIFDVVKTPIFADDSSRKYLLVHGRNITEEVENNKHISMLIKALNHASDSIAVTDHEHRILYANDAFCNNYGFDLKDILLKPMSIISSGTTPTNVYDNMKQTIIAGEPWTGILDNRTSSGKNIKEVVTITPVLNGKPYPVYYICVKRLLERRGEDRG
jgi:PAS domain S-box-containing protein